MWKLIFHISEIFNINVGFYEPDNYSVEIEVSADEMFRAIKRKSIYVNNKGYIELSDEGRKGGDHIRIFDDCSLNEC